MPFILMIEFTGCYSTKIITTSEITQSDKYLIHSKKSTYLSYNDTISDGILLGNLDFNRKNFYDLNNIDIYLASDSGLIVNNDRISFPVNSIKKIQLTVPPSIMSQKINLDTLNIDELNLYKDKAAKLRNAGKIVIISGGGIAIAGLLSSVIWTENFKGESGEGFITLVPLAIGIAVSIPVAVVGFTLSAAGASREARAEFGLKKFDIIQKKSMALEVGVTLRF